MKSITVRAWEKATFTRGHVFACIEVDGQQVPILLTPGDVRALVRFLAS
jgi:hypothetical protein